MTHDIPYASLVKNVKMAGLLVSVPVSVLGRGLWRSCMRSAREFVGMAVLATVLACVVSVIEDQACVDAGRWVSELLYTCRRRL